MRRRARRLALPLTAFALIALALFTGPAGGAPAAPAPKLGFVYVGPVSDVGWSWAHDQGRLRTSKEMGAESIYLENVAEGPDAERALRGLAAKGCDIIFATSFGYMDSVIKVASEYPKLKFEHCTGYKRAPNVSTYDGRGYEAWYLAGMVAGKMTRKNTIGYIVPYPIPECVRNLNAFTLGARSVNPKTECRIVTINAWFDPVKEREAAQALVDAGVDVLARESDSNAPDQLAGQRGIYAIGYNSVKGAGAHVLTAPVWDWSIRYKKAVEECRKGTWKSEAHWGGMKEGIIDLAPLAKAVPADVASLVKKKREAIKAAKFHPFSGELRDRDGKVRQAQGKTLGDAELLSMDWLVAGVVGSLK